MNSPIRKPLISLCMIVKNEEESLSQCLKSVSGIAEEIIVVDTGSTDSTVSIALSFGATVIQQPWSGDFATARNAGLEQANGQWILIMDGDEELEPNSKGELLLCAEHTEFEAFFLRIHNHKGITSATQTITVNPVIRMFRNRPEYRFRGIIHEQIAEAILQATPNAAMHLTTVVIHHYGYAEGIVLKKDKIKRNVELLKEQLSLNPADPFHHFNMAVEYMRLGEYHAALEHIIRSLAEAPPGTSYVHLLYKYQVRCLAELKNHTEALKACERGINSHPDYPDLAHMKGTLLFQLGAYADAKSAFLQALRIGEAPSGYHTEPGYGSYLTYYLLGQLCEELGDETEASVCYTKSAQLHPEPIPVIARLLRTLKCAERGGEIYDWCRSHLPDYTAAKNELLLQLFKSEGCDEAVEQLLRNSLQSLPTDESLALHPVYQPVCRQLLMADRLLASLSSSPLYSPASRRARLAFPLPRVTE